MQIRSITVGVDASWPLANDTTAAAGAFLERAKSAFEAEKIVVQTTRLATQPAHRFLVPTQLPEFASALQAACVERAIAYAAVGGMELGGAWTEAATPAASIDAAAATDLVFSSLQIASDQAIHFSAVRAAATVIAGIATRTAN